MKKSILIVGICVTVGFTGCQGGGDDAAPAPNDGDFTKLSTQNEPGNRENPMSNDDLTQGKFGYVRMQKTSDFEQNGNGENVPTIDRERVAGIISRIALQIEGIQDLATLVTDEEVLIAYNADTDNRMMIADQVKKTAFSVIPRYFRVYVSDAPRAIEDIERFQSLSSHTENVDDLIDHTIREMKKSPQGYKLNDGENENGESINERNAEMNDDEEKK